MFSVTKIGLVYRIEGEQAIFLLMQVDMLEKSGGTCAGHRGEEMRSSSIGKFSKSV